MPFVAQLSRNLSTQEDDTHPNSVHEAQQEKIAQQLYPISLYTRSRFALIRIESYSAAKICTAAEQ